MPLGVGRTVGLAEGVSPRDEGDGLLVVHGHAGEGLADIARGCERIRHAIGALGVDVDEAHLHRAEWILKHAVTGVAHISKPLLLTAPVGLVGLPHISTTATESEGLKAHALHRHIAGENKQIGPGQLRAVLGLDRPQQATSLVEVDVVGPAVERGEALQTLTTAATAVTDAVGARAVPRHADEEGAVVAVVGRPPFLGVRHDGAEVCLNRGEVNRCELSGVVKVLAHRVGLGRILLQNPQVELLRPPVIILGADAGPCRHRALALVRHGLSSG